MFISETHLPQLLSPEAYCSENQFRAEVDTLFKPAWHFVGTTFDIPKVGQYFTVDLLGHSVLVRNTGNGIRAFLNVCCHRHCTLALAAQGSSPKIVCPYHGWEYDDTGATRRIPDATSFKPLSRDQLGLKVFRSELIGPLIFVTLADEGPDLAGYLGDAYPILKEWYSSAPLVTLDKAAPVVEANWKLQIEIALESYHIGSVHAKTLFVQPPEEICSHEFNERFSVFTTTDRDGKGWSHWFQGAIARGLGRTPKYVYHQMLVYPNLLCGYTDLGANIQTVLPISPGRHHSIWRMFTFPGLTLMRWAAQSFPTWLGGSVAFWRNVMKEDLSILPPVQRGMASPQHPAGGLISKREERIFHFQQYIQSQTRDMNPVVGATGNNCTECGRQHDSLHRS